MARGDVSKALRDLGSDLIGIWRSPLRYVVGGARALYWFAGVVLLVVVAPHDTTRDVHQWLVDPEHRHILLFVTMFAALLAALLRHVVDRVGHIELARRHERAEQVLRDQIQAMETHAHASTAPILAHTQRASRKFQVLYATSEIQNLQASKTARLNAMRSQLEAVPHGQTIPVTPYYTGSTVGDVRIDQLIASIGQDVATLRRPVDAEAFALYEAPFQDRVRQDCRDAYRRFNFLTERECKDLDAVHRALATELRDLFQANA